MPACAADGQPRPPRGGRRPDTPHRAGRGTLAGLLAPQRPRQTATHWKQHITRFGRMLNLFLANFLFHGKLLEYQGVLGAPF